MALRKFCWWDDNVDAVVVVDSPTHTTEIKPAVWGVERRREYRGVFFLSKFSAFQYLLCIFGCCLSLEVLANEAYETVFCCATNAKIETAVPCDMTPNPALHLPLPAFLKNFFALEHIYCGCQGKMPIGIEVWMSWMGKWVTPYLLLLSHFVNL